MGLAIMTVARNRSTRISGNLRLPGTYRETGVNEAFHGKHLRLAPIGGSIWRADDSSAFHGERNVGVAIDADDLVELFFFAYRDFVGDADRLLENYRFGRAHHRVLHFVNRRPGLTIAALLDILKITKQSLNRVLKQLLDGDFVEARAGATDRRQRQLFVTSKGENLARELASLQSRRLLRVLEELSPDARAAATEFLLAMIDVDEREHVRAHLSAKATEIESIRPEPRDSAS